MSSNLSLSIVAVKPRETSGSRSSNRFDFQKDWALCHLLKLHSNQDDYLLILDYHDDVVVLDSEHKPASAHFYQIKAKKSGNWTIGALVKNKKGIPENSIIGKLYSNYKTFPEHTKSLVFISNQGLSTILANKKKGLEYDSIKFECLKNQDKEKIHKNVEGDDAKYCDINGLRKISYKKTELSPTEHASDAKGKLVDFFESIEPDKIINIPLAYKTLFDEIRRKTNSEIICYKYDQLRSKKGIGYNDLKNMINLFLDHANTDDLWREINQTLNNEGYEFSKIKKIKNNWRKYIVDRMDSGNEHFIQFRKQLCSAVEEFEDNSSGHSLKALVDKIKKNNRLRDYDFFDNDYIEAAIICEAMS